LSSNMRLGESELERPSVNPMYFVDSNVFLELELDQRRADECEVFLEKVRRGLMEALITGFHIDSILVVMENYGVKPSDLRTFLSSLLGYRELTIYLPSLHDRILATEYMEEFGLDLDDALAYRAMKKLNINNIVSYDKHFNLIRDITRLEPSQLQ